MSGAEETTKCSCFLNQYDETSKKNNNNNYIDYCKLSEIKPRQMHSLHFEMIKADQFERLIN